ncbi:alpha/beta hydrolase [Pseudomonas sp. RGM 3321]|uniref:alpha/beta hydrolase n=1 Tax=Pseudomonas sp. RGM 3321 TaxID=2930089 RepID=UPI001FCB5030|nr:alpha/beta hydrolase [Pseudomonas sp. RGM 3321]MCJ2374439.1 alpha/beta hydrolase [Pseudomonas sp. RGM 3321]
MTILSFSFIARPIALLMQRAKPNPPAHLSFPEIPRNMQAIVIPTSVGDATCTAYRPSEHKSACPPVHVNFHGGGFIMGYPQQDDPQCRYLAARGDLVVINVDYVLAPQNPFPAAVHQAFEIVRWVAGNGAANGWDGARLTIGGQSAGGALAAAAALQALDAGGPDIALQFLHYPPLDLVTSGYDKHAKIDNPVVSARVSEIINTVYIPNAADRASSLASPVHGSNADGIGGIAPAFVVTAEFDLLHDEGVAYANKLRNAGALVEHRDLKGVDHAYNILGKDQDGSQALTREIYELLITHIHETHATNGRKALVRNHD